MARVYDEEVRNWEELLQVAYRKSPHIRSLMDQLYECCRRVQAGGASLADDQSVQVMQRELATELKAWVLGLPSDAVAHRSGREH